jgi:hypothetical protein
VIGANSLVRGKIPPRCLAVGFPARVVSKEPEFPRVLSTSEKEAILREMMKELVAHLQGEGIQCRMADDCLEAWTAGWGFVRRRPALRRLRFVTSHSVEEPTAETDVLVSLHHIPDRVRDALAGRGTMWIDLESKERPDTGNDLGEQTVQHLRRHGVRLYRVKTA